MSSKHCYTPFQETKVIFNDRDKYRDSLAEEKNVWELVNETSNSIGLEISLFDLYEIF